MGLEKMIVLAGALTVAGCTVPNWIPLDHKEAEPPAALTITVPKGDSIGDVVGELREDDWHALVGNAYAGQRLAFGKRSGIVADIDGESKLNFAGGANVYKHILEFNDGGLDLGEGSFYAETGIHTAFPDVPVFIMGEEYLISRVDFNPDSGEIWMNFDSIDMPGKNIRAYDDNVYSDAYSKRETTINGVRQTNLDVKIEGNLQDRKVFRMQARHQVFPNSTVRIGPCEAASDHVDTMPGFFDIHHYNETAGCDDYSDAYTIVVNTE